MVSETSIIPVLPEKINEQKKKKVVFQGGTAMYKEFYSISKK